MFNGHGIAIAMVAIFVGMGLVVATLASDGAIFGLDLNSGSDKGEPIFDSDTGAGALSGDAFNEGSDAASNLTSKPTQRSAALSEEERGLLAIGNFPWDSIAMQYVNSSQDIMDMFDQQNFTRPPQPAREPLFLSDDIFVSVDRDGDRYNEPIETQTETANDDEGQEEETQDEEDQQDDSDQGESGTDSSGTGDAGDQSGGSGSEEDSGSGNEGDSGSSDSGSNSTNTNSTSSDSGSSDSSDGGNSTSSDSSSVEASVSIG
jgi:hypothetical protein